jgi:hypothetical protein
MLCISAKSAARKTSATCSVENLASSRDHDVEGQRSENDFAVLIVTFAGSQGGVQEPFEHAVDGFDLPALGVSCGVEARCHLAPPISGGKLFRRPTDEGWNEGADVALVASVFVR